MSSLSSSGGFHGFKDVVVQERPAADLKLGERPPSVSPDL